MASSVRAFFGGGASSDLCAAKKAATAAFRSPSGPACLRNASSGGVRGRGGAGDGFFGWGTAADLSAADFFTRRIVREIRRGAARERSARLGDVFF